MSGTLNYPDILAVHERLRTEPWFMAGWRLLLDCSSITDWEMSAADVWSFASLTRGDSNDLAIVAPQPALYGLARMYELLSKQRTVLVCRSIGEVRTAWELSARKPAIVIPSPIPAPA